MLVSAYCHQGKLNGTKKTEWDTFIFQDFKGFCECEGQNVDSAFKLQRNHFHNYNVIGQIQFVVDDELLYFLILPQSWRCVSITKGIFLQCVVTTIKYEVKVRRMASLLLEAKLDIKMCYIWLIRLEERRLYCKALALDVVLIWAGLWAKRMRRLGEI